MAVIQSMLSAEANGSRVDIGIDSVEQIRVLSDSRSLACPFCKETVILKAGRILAPHFAHLSGSKCSHPDAEPETERHREGKRLLSEWMRRALPEFEVIMEAAIPETGQRADVLITSVDGERTAIEYQCADLSSRDWARRHTLYRTNSIRDLWILGANRLAISGNRYRLGELELGMLAANAPLLFFDSIGENLERGYIGRLRVSKQGNLPLAGGKLALKPLTELAFPWHLFDWVKDSAQLEGQKGNKKRTRSMDKTVAKPQYPTEQDVALEQWLRLRFRAEIDSLPGFFGIEVKGSESISCSPRIWQACVYYQWVHGRLGETWNLDEVAEWLRHSTGLNHLSDKAVKVPLREYERLLAAAGFLSALKKGDLSMVAADLNTMAEAPNAEQTIKIAAYRRTLHFERE